MALRLIEAYLPSNGLGQVEEALKECFVVGVWTQPLQDERVLLSVLADAEQIEPVLDLLEQQFSSIHSFRIVLLPVEATLPRAEEPEKKENAAEVIEEEQPEQENRVGTGRISREELYNDITDAAKLNRVFLIMVFLSTIVAAIGLLRDNVAVIIGAMVIAPLLAPNVALSLATTLGDLALARRATKILAVGLVFALPPALLIGVFSDVDPATGELASRIEVGLGDIGLALASGVAGALAFTTGIGATLIGVMVAVALLPPLVAFGLLLGAGFWEESLRALELSVANLICINLAGVVTFLVQGVRPLSWWEADKAKKATMIAIAFWMVLLGVLTALIVLSTEVF